MGLLNIAQQTPFKHSDNRYVFAERQKKSRTAVGCGDVKE